MNISTYENQLQVSVSAEGEVESLANTRFGWGTNRKKGRRLVRIYRKSKYDEYADRVEKCATTLQFYEMANGDKQLMFANFCHLRLCPMCSARRSLRMAYRLSQVMNLAEKQHPGCMFLFLTLTIKNVEGEQGLKDALTLLNRAWARLTDNRQFERSIGGWFRALEITRKGKGYHPHIHAILAVPPEYFARKSGLYISHDEWVERWQKSLRADYKPSVRIQTTKAKGEYSAGQAAAVEAAKYAVKDSDYIDPRLSDDEAAQIVRDYTEALRSRRLTAFGGWLKDAARELKAENLDDGDLIHTEDQRIRPDVADFITTYNWHFGAGDYILSRREVNPLKIQRKG